MTSERMPVLFVGHGNPMNTIESNDFHRSWQDLARQLSRPRAILSISAHWETSGVLVTGSTNPDTIHDFYGFPQALFDVRYPAPGDPALARRVVALLSEHGARLDAERGLDHGVWGVLVPMYPQADIPVVQMSLDRNAPAALHYSMAKALAPLRDEGVLILASGNIIHNLALFRFHDPKAPDWAIRFDEEVKRLLRARAHAALIAYDTLDPSARLAIPTPEHYLPLLYAIALQREDESLHFFNSTVLSTISMTSVLIGAPLQDAPRAPEPNFRDF